MSKVNLDALIPREDFEVENNANIGSGTKKDTFSIQDLEFNSFFWPTLRKPDFQRETNEWDSCKICELIKSFVEGDLIPAIILWQSKSRYLFVIDGSHRLSALSAWVNDDYGDGQISQDFYDGEVPDEQKKIANETRKLVNKTVGSYQQLKCVLAERNPVNQESVQLQYAKNLGAFAIKLQWVEGDASKAESSFFNINQQAAPIDKTELKLLKARKKPNSIAARAIIRSGKGHKYWSSFSEEVQDKIQDIAQEINKILFEPALKNPIKTLDLPIAGKLYSSQALPLIVDFINIVNKIDFNNKGVSDDTTGEQTIKFLKNVKKIANKLNSNDCSSLGLHPIVYFYSKQGRYRTVSFLAMVDFIMELDQKKQINNFIDIREKFENFISRYDDLIPQIYQKHKNSQTGYKYLSKFYWQLAICLKSGNTEEEAIDKIQSTGDFKYLNFDRLSSNQQVETSGQKFTANKKSEIYIRDALISVLRCKICNGLIHGNSISIDHKQRKQDGGSSAIENGQITHPYCNTGYKH
ncbi:HNH endonuclease [Laspinema sp. C5]|nr:HNH endonuclease [Laspinema sp. D3c]MCT7996773.1 HNH endonuclease [Laspinema sp. D3c]